MTEAMARLGIWPFGLTDNPEMTGGAGRNRIGHRADGQK